MKNFGRKALIFVTALAVMVTLGSTVNAASDATPKMTDEEEREIRSNMDNLGISDDTQDKLIDKLNRGEQLDVMKPDQEISLEAGETEKTVAYPDGSVLKLEAEEDIGIQGCYSWGCDYNRKIRVYNPVSTGSYRIHYANVKGGYDEIHKVWDKHVVTTRAMSQKSWKLKVAVS